MICIVLLCFLNYENARRTQPTTANRNAEIPATKRHRLPKVRKGNARPKRERPDINPTKESGDLPRVRTQRLCLSITNRTDMTMKLKDRPHPDAYWHNKTQSWKMPSANRHCSASAGSSMSYVEHLERVVADLDAGEYPECGQASQTIRRLHRKYYPQNY